MNAQDFLKQASVIMKLPGSEKKLEGLNQLLEQQLPAVKKDPTLWDSWLKVAKDATMLVNMS